MDFKLWNKDEILNHASPLEKRNDLDFQLYRKFNLDRISAVSPKYQTTTK